MNFSKWVSVIILSASVYGELPFYTINSDHESLWIFEGYNPDTPSLGSNISFGDIVWDGGSQGIYKLLD